MIARRGQLAAGFRLFVVVTLTAAVTLAAPKAQAAAKARVLSWLAAGDSYSSGEGLPHSTGKCAQAFTGSGSKTWAAVAAEQLPTDGPVRFTDPQLIACTGAVTANFSDSSDAHGHPEWSAGQYNLLTFTFGGNDVGFADIIQQCIGLDAAAAGFEEGAGLSPPSLPASDPGHLCPADKTVRQHIADTIGAHYPDFLSGIAKQAVTPGGNMVVLGYPEFVEAPQFWNNWEKAFGCWGLSQADALELRGLAGNLNATLGQAVSAFNAEPADKRMNVKAVFVDVNSGGGQIHGDDANLFEPSSGARHNLCSNGEAWMNGVQYTDFPRGSFHPKQAGINSEGKLAAAVIKTLDWSRLAPLVQAPPQLILPANCGPITSRIGDAVDVRILTGTISCAQALATARGYNTLPGSELSGSGGQGQVGSYTCISTSGADYQQSGHASDCTSGGNHISLDRPAGVDCGMVGQGVASDVIASGVDCTLAREIGGSVYAGDDPPGGFRCVKTGPITFEGGGGTGYACQSTTSTGSVRVLLGPIDSVGVGNLGTSLCQPGASCETVHTGGGSVNVRNGASTTASILATLKDGQQVSPHCRTHGETVSGPEGTTDYWDAIYPSGVISDAFLGAANQLLDC